MNREQDIAQIRKYLNGELDARAMHELERRALDDPFLADAIDGFEQVDSDQQANLNDLSVRLKQCTDQKEKRIIPWQTLSIAASILVVLGGGIWFFSSKQAPQEKLVAENIKPDKKSQPEVSSPSPAADVALQNDSTTVSQKQSEPKQYTDKKTEGYARSAKKVNEANNAPVADAPMAAATSTPEVDQLYKPKKDSVAANELIVKEMNQKKPADAVSMKEVAIAKSKPPAATETMLQSRADGVSATPDNKSLSGIITDQNGQPITGATVKVMGRPFGVVTDAQGKFSLSGVSSNQTLSVNYIGYNSKKVRVSNQDSLTISLQPNSSSLAEVVVTKTVQENGGAGAASADARPKDGWDAFNKYLKDNAQSPDAKTGKVKLSFMVAADGSLSQFKVTKSLSDAADKKATDLVTNGPAWIGGTDGKPKEVKVTVSFK